MELARVLPFVTQFVFGALLFGIAVYSAFKGNYVSLKLTDDRRLLGMLAGGYLLMLLIAAFFTFLAPYWCLGGAM